MNERVAHESPPHHYGVGVVFAVETPGLIAQSIYGLADQFRVLGILAVLFFAHTHRVEPDQTVSASGQGKGDNRGGAPNPQGHRGPIQVWIAQRKFEWEGSQSVPTHCFVMATN